MMIGDSLKRVRHAPSIYRAVMPESDLRKHLRTISKDFADRADVIWARAAEVQEHASKINDSSNGPIHCHAVETNLFRLLNESGHLASYKPLELFVLSVTAACHDFDKGLPPTGFFHGDGSGRFIYANREKLGLQIPEAAAVDVISSIHNYNDAEFVRHLDDIPQSLGFPQGSADVRRLAVIFKAADVLQCNAKRVSALAIDIRKLTGLTRAKTLARQCTSDWLIDGVRIVVDAFPETNEEHFAVCDSSAYMKDHEWGPFATELRSYRLPHILEFRISPRHLQVSASAPPQAPRGLPGMDHYQAADAQYFVGREVECMELLNLVLGHKVCVLVGDSGIGKSSLLHAGLAPRINALEGCRTIITRPDKSRGTFFTAADFAGILGSPPGLDISFPDLCGAALNKVKRLIIILDQFEDVAYQRPLNSMALSSAVLDGGRKADPTSPWHGLHLLFSYRGDAESILRPVFNAIAHSSTGVPTYPLQRLTREKAKASIERLLDLQQLRLLPPDTFLDSILDELAVASDRDSRFPSGLIYPPYVQLVLGRLRKIATGGAVALSEFQALARGDSYDRTPTDIAIAEYFDDAINSLEGSALSPGVARNLLTAMVDSTGKKGAANQATLAAECSISADELSRYLETLTGLRLIRRLESGEYEIIHDHFARRLSDTLSVSDRAFKQARESLRARALAYYQHYGSISPAELKTLWIHRDRIRPASLTTEEKLAILLAMATLDSSSLAHAAYPYSDDGLGDSGRPITESVNWSAPGWCWLFYIGADELLSLGRIAAKTGETLGAVAYLRIASLVRSEAEIPRLIELLKGPFSAFPKFAEDTIDCVASLVTPASLPLLRNLAKDANPFVRRAAAKAIGSVGTINEMGILSELATDRQPNPALGGDCDVRSAVAKAIGTMGFRDGISTLRSMANDGAHQVTLAVAEGIAKIGDQSDLPLLRKMGASSHRLTQHAAAKTYAILTINNDLALLRELARGADDLLRQGAAWIIRERGGPEDLPFLRKLLTSDNQNCIQAAIAAIGKWGHSEDLPALRALAASKTHEWPVRRCAVKCIAELRSREDLSFLQEVHATDRTPHIVGTAARNATWDVLSKDDIPQLYDHVRTKKPGAITAVNTLARLTPVGDRFMAMADIILDGRSEVATACANIAVPFATPAQLTEFLSRYQARLSPQTLAVFDWHLYSPDWARPETTRSKPETTSDHKLADTKSDGREAI